MKASQKKNFEALLGAMGGGVAAGFVVKQIDNMPNIDPKIAAVIPIAVGYFLSTQKGVMSSLGLGMAAAGAPRLLAAFNVPGIGEADLTADEVDEFEEIVTAVNGMDDDDETIFGDDNPLAGMDFDDDY